LKKDLLHGSTTKRSSKDVPIKLAYDKKIQIKGKLS